jgi:hypothetical protein
LSEVLHGRELQRQTLRLYGELMLRNDSLASKLVFTAGSGSSATGLAAAVSILGGTSLIVDPDAAVVRSVLRQGGVDFVVNTLDEALRVLKNEIRKHTPLSVVLVADVDASVQEMSERGVMPDVEVQIAAKYELASALETKTVLRLLRSSGIIEPSEPFSQWLVDSGWEERLLDVDTIAALRTLDVRLISMLGAEDSVRLRWLQRIAQYQRPSAETGRVMWLRSSEFEGI